MNPTLCIEDLHAAYGQQPVLRGVTLDVKPGEIVAVIGPNGAGKSTVLRVVAGFLSPSKGEVRLGDHKLTSLPPHERVRCGLGYAMQGARIFESLTVLEHLRMGSNGEGLDRSSVLEAFAVLRPLLNRRAGLLSGGERQALSIAMILVRCPRILMLDEPSAGLAPDLVRDTLGTVRRLTSELKLGVLLVEQNVTQALRIADRAVALVAGEMVMSTDQPEGWLSTGELEHLFLGSRRSIRP